MRPSTCRAKLSAPAWLISAVLLLWGCASAPSISKVEAAKVHVVNDADLVRTCQMLGTVADSDFEDLQKKAARLGGNVALLTRHINDKMIADVYRCGGSN